jgi:hypothetical protein
MKISIVQDEIEKAIKDYMGKFLRLEAGKGFKVDMTATRGQSGITADIEIVDAETKSQKEEESPIAPPSEPEEAKQEEAPEEKKEQPKKSFFAGF